MPGRGRLYRVLMRHSRALSWRLCIDDWQLQRWHPVESDPEATHMYIFHRPYYNSDITQFLEQLKAARPELQAQQEAGRALLWDKAVDRSAWSEYRAAQVPQQPYVYQSHDQ